MFLCPPLSVNSHIALQKENQGTHAVYLCVSFAFNISLMHFNIDKYLATS
jgi:hypothetical protein